MACSTAPPSATATAAVLLLSFLAGCGGSQRAAEPLPEEDGAKALRPAEVDFTDLPVRTSNGRDFQFAPGRVLHDPAQGPAIVLEGQRRVLLDLTGLELRGQGAEAPLDGAAGVGIAVRGCEDVEIRGGLLGGFRVCVEVEDSVNVRLVDMRFDGWYGQRLRSTAFAEDLSDWLRPHRNDEGEWAATYGGAISIAATTDATVAGCRGRRGQNGILLTRAARARIYDNDFSFLSGWGLALYRSSDNVVSRNVFDYCVRGYSHDVYWRGQDSAGILLFEQCSRNVVARNSATHCGDGVFLYAGDALVQRGLDTASGSDHNIFWRNDLRHAVANGLEATFSRGNAVLENDLSGAHQHGLWGGYSADMIVVGNEVRNVLGPAVSIEHGQDCIVAENTLAGSEIGFEAWWDDDPEFVDGPFGRRRSTASRGHWVVQNRFEDNVLDLVVRRSSGLIFHGNSYVPGRREAYFETVGAENDPTLDATTVQRWLDALDGAFPSGNLSRSTLNPWTGRPPAALVDWRSWEAPADLPGRQETRAELRDESGGGLESIVMGEWGPWDFRSGAPRPEVRRPGGLLEDAVWDATWFRWENGASDPRTAERAWRARATAPLLRRRAENFVNPWGTDEVRRRVGNDFFGLFAGTTVRVPAAGEYEVLVTSDDGVRVFVDERLVVERWSLHAAARDAGRITLDAGEHTVRLEYFQVQGAAALVVELRAVD
ncbi:MAG: NosD domain-containing protein, partial [Planctomycetota bacterium]